LSNTRYTRSLGMNACIDSEVKIKGEDGVGMRINAIAYVF